MPVLNILRSSLTNLTNISRCNQINKSKLFFIKHNLKILMKKTISGCLSSIESARRSELFQLEKERQQENVGRIEKIEVRFLGLPSDTTLVMNKGISTPFNCAQRKYYL